MHSAPDQPITLTKHHGLGNDFLIAVDPPRPLGRDDAIAWCDRREGIGADGLIQATPVADPSGTRTRWQMVLFNSDGGRAEISGNGLRCLAQAIADHLGHDRATDLVLVIDTDAGTREAIVAARGLGPDDTPSSPVATTDQVTVGMGKAVEGPAPSSRWDELGVDIAEQLGVDLGNPHLVGFVDGTEGLGGFDMAAIGPVVEADHPGGLNVHLVRVAGPARLEMVIWERGAGVTMACGSGACAAAWTAVRTGRVEASPAGIEVVMPGGSARVTVADDEVILTGPAVRVGEVRLDG